MRDDTTWLIENTVCEAGAYHSSTFRLNVSALCGIEGAFKGGLEGV